MKYSILLICLIFIFSNSSFSQINEAKKDVNEVFFEIGNSPSKFEVRKLFHGDDNFFDFWENDYGDYFTISSAFQQNFKLSYLGNAEKNIFFWFPKGSDKSDSRKIHLEYTSDEFNLCKQQFEELLNIFSKVSYKKVENLIQNNKKEQTGEGWVFFSSEKSFNEKKSYLDFHYRYYSALNPNTNKTETGYIFEIIYHEENLY